MSTTRWQACAIAIWAAPLARWRPRWPQRQALPSAPLGWVLAWVSQIACLALGLLTPWMYVVGGAFAALFVVEFVLGRRIETDTAAR